MRWLPRPRHHDRPAAWQRVRVVTNRTSRVLRWQFVTVLVIAVAACISSEPTTEQIRGTYERNRGSFEDLRRLFTDDVKSHRLVSVSAAASAETRCGERHTGLTCLDDGRWRQYAAKMEPVGIRRIELHRETAGVYFHLYRSTWDMWRGEFRFRGVVYAPGSPTVTHDHDDTEERVDIGDGWYAFLIVDS